LYPPEKVILRAAPVATVMMYIWGDPPRSEVTAIMAPSGENDGETSMSGPLLRRLSPVPPSEVM
jgi:hypothetical protein